MAKRLHPLMRLRIPSPYIGQIYHRTEVNSLGCQHYSFGATMAAPSSKKDRTHSPAARANNESAILKASLEASVALLQQLPQSKARVRSNPGAVISNSDDSWLSLPNAPMRALQQLLPTVVPVHPAIASYETAVAPHQRNAPNSVHPLLQVLARPRASSLLLDPDRVVLLFGRRSTGAFSLDFQAPINSAQAICIALASFDSKLSWP